MVIKVLVLFRKKKKKIPNELEMWLLCEVLKPALEVLLVFLFTRNLICEMHHEQVPCKVRSSKHSPRYISGNLSLPPSTIFPLQGYKERKHLFIEKYFQNSVTLLAKVLNLHGNREGIGKLGVCIKERTLFTCQKSSGDQCKH